MLTPHIGATEYRIGQNVVLSDPENLGVVPSGHAAVEMVYDSRDGVGRITHLLYRVYHFATEQTLTCSARYLAQSGAQY